MHDSFYNSSSLNTNIEGMTPWGAGAQGLWGQWGQSLPRGGAVAAGQAQWGCHCCAFSCGWHSLSIPVDIPLFVPFPLYPSGCCGLLPALHLLLPVLLNRAASSSHWFGHCPLCQRPHPEVLLRSPQRKHSCFHTCSELWQGCAIQNTWFPKCLVEIWYKISKSQQLAVGNRFC